MTCIIGLEHEGKVYIGGDSSVTRGWEVSVTDQSKVIRVGCFLVGLAGTMRQLNLLEHHVHPRAQEEGESDEHYVAIGLVEAIRQCFKDNGASKISDNQENSDSIMLVGFKGKLYMVGSAFDVTHFERGFAAIGAGDDYAIGSLITQQQLFVRDGDEGNHPMPEMLCRALGVAAYMSAVVRAPFKVESI